MAEPIDQTPVATLCVDLEHGKRHVRRFDFNKWDLTPAGLREQRAPAIFSVVEGFDPEVLEFPANTSRRQVRRTSR